MAGRPPGNLAGSQTPVTRCRHLDPTRSRLGAPPGRDEGADWGVRANFVRGAEAGQVSKNNLNAGRSTDRLVSLLAHF